LRYRWRHRAIGCLAGLPLAAFIFLPPPASSRAGMATRGFMFAHASATAVGPPVSVQLSDSETGYVSASVSGAAAEIVQLSEDRGAHVTAIRRIQLPSSGTVVIPHLLSWACRPRARTVRADAVPPVDAPAIAGITTPSCAGRLSARIPAGGTVGATQIRLRDRWRIGDLPATVCVTPPGGARHCTAARLVTGHAQRTVRVALDRPGGWLISAGSGFGPARRRLVWAAPRGGAIRVLAAGDSEMQILDGFLAQQLGSRHVKVQNDARISTGLTNSSFFNWQNEARARAASFSPDVTVVFMGANDGFSVAGPGGAPVGCCGSAWSHGYANLAASMMRTLLRGNAGRVYWCLLPTPRPANFKSVFDGVNGGIRRAARRFSGRVALIDTNALFTPGNRYRDYMTYAGHGFVIHQPDGIHLSIAGDTLVALLVKRRLLADRVIH
jgi:lysophospholipase L1-like esterase